MIDKTQNYGTFEGSRLGPPKWELLQAPMGPGKTHVAQEPGAKITISGGTIEIKVDCFQNSGNIPALEHPKHLYVSKEYFPLSPTGISTFSVEMAAENIGGNPDDYRDGVAGFVVQDMETAMIFDGIANGKRTY